MTVVIWPLIKRLFFETNIPLPANAACKHLFSAAGHIFTPMRARIGDTNFENQLLLNLNKGFAQWTEGGSTCGRLWIFLSVVYIWLLLFGYNKFSLLLLLQLLLENKIVLLFTQVDVYKFTFTATRAVLKGPTSPSTQVQNKSSSVKPAPNTIGIQRQNEHIELENVNKDIRESLSRYLCVISDCVISISIDGNRYAISSVSLSRVFFSQNV